MGDEKWILCIMWNGRDHWTNEMNHHQLYQRLVFIQRRWCCVYGGVGLAHLSYALLPENQRINSNKSCSQLDQLKAALTTKCPELVNRKHIFFHQDIARPPVSLMTRQKLLELGWEVLIHLPYSPDMAPLNFYFILYKILLMEKNFNSLEDCKRHLKQFFAWKD